MSATESHNLDDLYPVLRNFRQNGILTPYLRKLLIERRTRFNLTRQQVSKLFNTTPQTIKYWEIGQTRRCNIMHRAHVANFLTGAFYRISSECLPQPYRCSSERLRQKARLQALPHPRKSPERTKIVFWSFWN